MWVATGKISRDDADRAEFKSLLYLLAHTRGVTQLTSRFFSFSVFQKDKNMFGPDKV